MRRMFGRGGVTAAKSVAAGNRAKIAAEKTRRTSGRGIDETAINTLAHRRIKRRLRSAAMPGLGTQA
jgi:hypothetical protein